MGWPRHQGRLAQCLWLCVVCFLVFPINWVVANVCAQLTARGQWESPRECVDNRKDTASFRERLGFFMSAQAERQRRNYQRASDLYDAATNGLNSFSLDERQLRMWVQYQHADLLMRFMTPIANGTRARANAIKRQAVLKFYDAVTLSQHAWAADTSPPFGAGERVHAFNSMGLLLAELHEPMSAAAFFQRAIAANRSAAEPLGNLAILYLNLGDRDRALDTNRRALELQPHDARLVQNMGTILYAIDEEEQAQLWWQRTLKIDPNATEAMASLATVYGSRGDLSRARELLTRAVQVASPGLSRNSYRLQLAMSHLEMVYESTDQLHRARGQFEAALSQLHQEQGMLPDPLGTIGSGSMGYYAIYQAFNDRQVRRQLAQIYLNGARDVLEYVAPHASSNGSARLTVDSVNGARRPRIRVGFISAFLYHHSVGLLLSGVIRHLSPDRFDVFVVTYDTARNDSLTKRLESSVPRDRVIVVPERDLWQAQRRVASLELDVLVFGEIGMHAATYFLAFARLAHRTVQFWGHAVTSGIETVDYFVSSTLFRRDQSESDDHERYTECLYEMEGLTTLFPEPPAPQTGLTRVSFDLPTKGMRRHMVLVPQTLYKLHPDFDAILQRILSRVTTAMLVLPIGDKPMLVQQLTRCWRQGRVIDANVYKRIFFVRKLNQTEFLALCAMADLVLDPFPVGGGRSSFEVFSVGTPILGLTSRTSVLQLTLGMYRRMGIDVSCCMVDDEDILVDRAVTLLHDDDARQALHKQIQEQNHKLYEGSNARVVRELEVFFEHILSINPPTTVSDTNPFVRRCTAQIERGLRPRLVYQSALNDLSTASSQTIQLFDLQDAFDVALSSTSDMLQAAFLGKILWSIQQRFRRDIVDVFSARSKTSGAAYPIEIREGDDLHQTVRWQLQQTLAQQAPHPLDALDRLEAQVVSVAQRRIPQHTSDAWRDARALTPPRAFDTRATRRQHCVALVVTTCKRLALFVRTLRSLARTLGIVADADWRKHFCALLIIDDHSSDADRRVMQRAFPSFSFVWKTAEQKGHAASLNLMLRKLQWVRFVLYVEDDWEFRPQDLTSLPRDFVRDAVTVLVSTRLVQVLLNDQSSGYTRQLSTTTSDSTNHTIHYAVHEFAVLDPAHSFAYWPGFSLNPGVWDLDKLAAVVSDHHPSFQEDSDMFEQIFSLRVWRAGLHVGYLHGSVVCDHIGTNASAYVLNGLPRRFD